MVTGSQVFAAPKDSSAARKDSMKPGEFSLIVLVVMAATVIGGIGGIWIAEHGRSNGKPGAASARAPVRPAGQPPSVASKPLTTDASTAVASKATKQPATDSISLGLPTVRAIHHSRESDHTEIAVELRSAELLHVAQLHNPERVYFDLADSSRTPKSNGRLKSRREVSLRDDRVARIRVVRWQSGSVRLVVDLKRPCQYSYRLSPDPPSILTLRFWTTQPSDTLAGPNPSRHEGTGIPEAVAAARH